MKAKRIATSLLLCLPFTAVIAQDAGVESDFYGVYAPPLFITSPALTEPETYPLTPEARRVFDTYEYAVPEDDCAPVPMPQILWVGSPMSMEREGDLLIIRSERAELPHFPLPLEALLFWLPWHFF